jgi:hypothetical protein
MKTCISAEHLAAYRKTFGWMTTGELRAVVEGRKPHKLSEASLGPLRVLLAERQDGGMPTGVCFKSPADRKSWERPATSVPRGRSRIDLPAGTARYAMDPSRQQVKAPQRALQRFTFEAKFTAAKNVGIAVAALVGLPLLALILHLIDRSVKGDAFPGNTFALLFLIGAPFVFLGFMLQSIRTLWVGCSAPKRATAAETLRTFLEAVGLRLWERAFNCLTDTAQDTGRVELPRADYLQQMMPKVRIESPESLGNFWAKVAFQWSPRWKAINTFPLDDRTARLILPLAVTWSVTNGGKEKRYEEEIETVFLAWRRAGTGF